MNFLSKIDLLDCSFVAIIAQELYKYRTWNVYRPPTVLLNQIKKNPFDYPQSQQIRNIEQH
jgi:hypothetical protein